MLPVGRKAYPIVISKENDGFYYVEIPDFDIATQGESVADAMEMARDAIGLMGIDFLDDGKSIPEPNSKEVHSGKDDIVTLVDVDFTEYRKKVDNKAVKKNCTIPYWLNVEAEKAGINFSKVLQDALMNVLGIGKAVN
ncbi:MAG TPA: type II toxin-antitoxin system HicB family antitoxin [Candidatus Mediterraneibacter merdipullorum]|nr:type II toxin-antitoxin system HicB family antitoxin [Candidatus Mediterraneibacter merdipullorum]